MADFTTVEKVNLLLKMVYGIQGFSNTDDANGLKWFNEKYPWSPFVSNTDIYSNDVPVATTSTEADAVVASNPLIIEKRTITLSPVSGTNGRAWIAFKTVGDANSGIYDDWLLPQKFGVGYAMRLFRDNGSGGLGSEITTTEGAWVPAYKLGAVILAAGNTAADLSWTTPLHAVIYRYIGQKGVSGDSAGVSLDNAYNVGSSITIDTLPVEFNASNSIAPLQITPITYIPNASLSAGQVCNHNGSLYLYDDVRAKWISIEKQAPSFSASKGDGNYLMSGNFSDINSGFVALKNGTIVGITASGGSGNQTKGFSIRKNGAESDIIAFSLTSGKYSNSTYNVDITAGDIIQVYCSAEGTQINAPIVQVYIAWRL